MSRGNFYFFNQFLGKFVRQGKHIILRDFNLILPPEMLDGGLTRKLPEMPSLVTAAHYENIENPK